MISLELIILKIREELLAIENWKERCLEILKCDIEWLRKLLNLPCITIASHGAPENRMLGISNNYLTEDKRVYDYLEIKLEAYNREFIENIVTCYISDCPVEINYGYRYGITPFEAIEKGEKCILFLTHPNHWFYDWRKRCRKITKSLLFGHKKENQVFRRI